MHASAHSCTRNGPARTQSRHVTCWRVLFLVLLHCTRDPVHVATRSRTSPARKALHPLALAPSLWASLGIDDASLGYTLFFICAPGTSLDSLYSIPFFYSSTSCTLSYTMLIPPILACVLASLVGRGASQATSRSSSPLIFMSVILPNSLSDRFGRLSPSTREADIKHSVTSFSSKMRSDGFHYFPASSTVMFLTESDEAWRSTNGGSTWTRVLQQAGRLLSLSIHDTNSRLVYILMEQDALLVSFNRGETFERRELPVPPNRLGLPVLEFHPDLEKADWVLFLGQREDECFTRLYQSKDHGYNWQEIDSWVERADFALQSNKGEGLLAMAWKKPMPHGVCQDEVVPSIAHPLQFVSYGDRSRLREVHFNHAAQFSRVGKYLVVAVVRNNKTPLDFTLDQQSAVRD